MSLLSIAKWNYERNKLEYRAELEDAMYAEEVKEYKDGLEVYLSNPLTKLECIVDMVDGYCDATFVHYGTIAKQLGHTKLSDRNYELSIMNTIITEILVTHKVKMYVDEGYPTIDMCMQAVIDANQAKPKVKTKTKVKKGEDWVDPKEQILSLLLERGYLEYPEVKEETLVEGE